MRSSLTSPVGSGSGAPSASLAMSNSNQQMHEHRPPRSLFPLPAPPLPVDSFPQSSKGKRKSLRCGYQAELATSTAVALNSMAGSPAFSQLPASAAQAACIQRVVDAANSFVTMIAVPLPCAQMSFCVSPKLHLEKKTKTAGLSVCLFFV